MAQGDDMKTITEEELKAMDQQDLETPEVGTEAGVEEVREGAKVAMGELDKVTGDVEKTEQDLSRMKAVIAEMKVKIGETFGLVPTEEKLQAEAEERVFRGTSKATGVAGETLRKAREERNLGVSEAKQTQTGVPRYN